MYMSSLKKMPRWLTLFPWFVMLCALLFSAGIVVFGLHNAKRESDFTSQLTLEKGAALISALEGALRTGMGYHWSDEVLSDRVNASTLKEPEEIKLAMQVVVLRDKLEPYFAEGRYQDALVELAELREPVDAFFDKVMVMVDDKELRINRLTMLEKLRELFLRVADISLLQ
mgnify:CR=1 FL=1